MNDHNAGFIRHPNTNVLCGALAAFMLLSAGASVAGAQTAPSPTVPSNLVESVGSSTLSRGDTKFIKKVARASTNEVALSQLADSRATAPEVKSFATMMVTDHTQANADLSTLAKSKGVDIAKQVDSGNLDGVSSLSSKSGVDFDKAYARLMLDAHTGAVKLFQGEVATGKDPEVVAFAKKYVDTLSMHLDHATALEKTVNP